MVHSRVCSPHSALSSQMLLMCERAVHTRVEMVVTVMAALLCAVLSTVAGSSTHAGTKPNV